MIVCLHSLPWIFKVLRLEVGGSSPTSIFQAKICGAGGCCSVLIPAVCVPIRKSGALLGKRYKGLEKNEHRFDS